MQLGCCGDHQEHDDEMSGEWIRIPWDCIAPACTDNQPACGDPSMQLFF
jgi:hypothetical protein